jgi:two-component system KDP operon response regulator KdpE
MATILYVDDEPAIRRAVKLTLAREGDRALTAATARRAVSWLQRYRFDGVFLDLWLKGGDSIGVYDWIREHQPALASRVAFITGELLPSPSTARRLEATGRPVIQKPFELATLVAYVRAWEAQPPTADPPTPQAPA